ncbi:DASH family cryptochrome [Vibrio lentus]|uniref:Cryptochrome DASH n=1 Tax=Vibrio lentus TaxID=136468 RepID=A0AB36XVJ6_9VIBR|nr:DASH family cryptochrome [Vibrio lentus]MCC4838501.1 DASH family cryptochrome [Vibrio lentus]PMI16980.1 FAD-binding protein [Vibrio lentus]PMK36494.1 FAD-binding protein [Vibrio lentus]PMK50522.1 FAD-binding protein [Vibrio lentus]PML32585.1 FAD-binding protein [Vibrio lentus]
MKKIGLYLFTNDLRINDNQLFHYAAQSVDKLICAIVEPTLVRFSADFAQEQSYGAHHQTFVSQSITNLESNLVKFGQRLVVIHNNHLEPDVAEQTLDQIIATQNVTHFFANVHCGYDERQLIHSLQNSHPDLITCLPHHSTLFDSHELPFELSKVPSSFTKFRKLVEHLDVNSDETVIARLPPPVTPTPTPVTAIPLFTSPNVERAATNDYLGGEDAGLAHLHNYFSHDYALNYKQTRNAFDGIENSTKFSPWLALGCVSPKTIYRHLKQFEAEHGSNDSTYWIYFELLWREYFYWKCLSLGSSMFGTNNESDNQHTSTTSNLCFAKWKSGNTNYPIVDACMRQLNETGYMSNRGRQLAASCLIYELGIDWRHGAAYFESQLIDYDVASNWGNWAYIAGELRPPVSAQTNKQKNTDQAQPKSHHFDLARQTDMYDPDHVFINKWNTFNKEPVLANNQDVL